MKNFTYVLITFLCVIVSSGALAAKELPGNKTATIDSGDTVVFDVSQSVIAGNKVSFPVYIITDDTINALDFSLQFDEMNFSLDSIINLTTYLQATYNYNSGTLYFTSYSLQEIDHNTNLLSISLNMLGHYLCSEDLDSLLVYLNGDACTVKIVDCISDAIPEKSMDAMFVFPNPANDILNVRCNLNSKVQLQDLKGSVVFNGANDQTGIMKIDVSQLPKGIYVLSLQENNRVSYQKVVVE